MRPSGGSLWSGQALVILCIFICFHVFTVKIIIYCREEKYQFFVSIGNLPQSPDGSLCSDIFPPSWTWTAGILIFLGLQMHIQHLPSVFVMFELQCNKVSPTKCYLQESSSYEIKGSILVIWNIKFCKVLLILSG